MRVRLDVVDKDMDSKLSAEDAKMPAMEISKQSDSAQKTKKRTNVSTSKGAKKKKSSIIDEICIDGGNSTEESDNDDDTGDEDQSLLDDDVELLDVEGKISLILTRISGR